MHTPRRPWRASAPPITMNPTESRLRCLQHSVCKKTLRFYAGRRDIFTSYISLMRRQGRQGYAHATHEGSEEIFADFLYFQRQQGRPDNKSMADKFRCAILQHQRFHNLPQWAATQTCLTIVKGFAYEAKKERTLPRGQITTAMHQEMIRYSKTHLPAFTHLLDITFRCALRISEVLSLKKGSYCSHSCRVYIPDKRSTSFNGMPTHTMKGVFDPYAQTVLLSLESNRNHDESYFPFTEATFRRHFHKIVDELGFHKRSLDVVFDGPHCLRHGGVAYLANSALGITHLQLQMTHVIFEHYRRTNAERAKDGPRHVTWDSDDEE